MLKIVKNTIQQKWEEKQLFRNWTHFQIGYFSKHPGQEAYTIIEKLNWLD